MTSVVIPKGMFQAAYAYGPKKEQLKSTSFLSNLFSTVVHKSLLRAMTFPAAMYSRWRPYMGIHLDDERIDESRQQLRDVTGGEAVQLKTPDGDHLDSTYFSAEQYKKNMLQYFDVVTEKKDGKRQKFFVLKKEYYNIEKRSSNPSKKVRIPKNDDKKLIEFLANVKRLGIGLMPFADLPGSEEKGLLIPIPDIPEVEKPVDNKRTPTVLICGGSGMPYSAYKGVVAAYLLCGINVMAFDYRGYGKSGGNPTPSKLILDAETAYQYLSTVKECANQDILIHGHCLGGGPAAELASRREKVNLLLDRTFAEYRDVASNIVAKTYVVGSCLKRIVHKVMPWIINFNNAEKINGVSGHIMINHDSRDETIPADQMDRLQKGLPFQKKDQVIRTMQTNIGHAGNWFDRKGHALDKFNQFLSDIGFLCNYSF